MPDSPKLRTVDKVKPPYPLNEFPKDFPYKLGRELVYLLASKGRPSLEGEEWEQIFATCIGAEWKKSNVGLDDIVLGGSAWGAKTVKKSYKSKTVPLISGRNSVAYSFGEQQVMGVEPNEFAEKILSIWNDRVSAVRAKYKHLRTVVLLKSEELDEVGVFEFETKRIDPELYYWEWHEHDDHHNLWGYNKSEKKHVLTWQPHGSQFTIMEKVPEELLVIRIKRPTKLDKEVVLKGLGFNKDWITIIKRNG